MTRQDPFKDIAVSKSKTNPKGSYKVIYNGVDPNKAEKLQITCPFCGKDAEYSLKKEDVPHWEITQSVIESETTITVMPALRHDRASGGCGLAGYLINGWFKVALDQDNQSPKVLGGEIKATLINEGTIP